MPSDPAPAAKPGSRVDLEVIRERWRQHEACEGSAVHPEVLLRHIPELIAKVDALVAERDALRAKVGTWIPIAERLPDDDRDVLTRNDQGDNFDGIPLPPFCEVNSYRPDRADWSWGGKLVTHWRELPSTALAAPDAGEGSTTGGARLMNKSDGLGLTDEPK
jgi:hypothetical protein